MLGLILGHLGDFGSHGPHGQEVDCDRQPEKARKPLRAWRCWSRRPRGRAPLSTARSERRRRRGEEGGPVATGRPFWASGRPAGQWGAGPRKPSPLRLPAGSGSPPLRDVGRGPWKTVWADSRGQRATRRRGRHSAMAALRSPGTTTPEESHRNNSLTRIFFPKLPTGFQARAVASLVADAGHPLPRRPCSSNRGHAETRGSVRVQQDFTSKPHVPHARPPNPDPLMQEIPGKPPEKEKTSGINFPDPPAPAGACRVTEQEEGQST